MSGHRTSWASIVLLAPVLFLLLTAVQCAPDDSDILLQDSIAPTISITSHADGDPYAPLTTILGTVTDAADDGAGEVDSMIFDVNSGRITGDVILGSGDEFSVDIDTEGLSGEMLLSLTATDWSGNITTEPLRLVPPKEITAFGFLVADNPAAGLGTDTYGDLAGTDILVSVADGTDVIGLIATFETTGKSVLVGGAEQESGVTQNDFDAPVDYLVVAKDNSTREYRVTVSAVPLPPDNLRTSSFSVSAINLTWNDNSNNESGFDIERKVGSGTFEPLATVLEDENIYTDADLTGDTEFTYQVRSINSHGSSEWSNELAVSLFPAAPSDLSITLYSPTHLRLNWTDNSPIEEHFEIERKAEGEAVFTALDTVSADITFYDDTTVSPVTEYSYQVRATNSLGESGYSNIATETTPRFYIDTADNTGNLGQYADIVLDGSDIHISYWYGSAGYLRYAYSGNGTSWSTATVDTGQVGQYSSIALDSAGVPHIAYYDFTNENAKHAWKPSSLWSKESIVTTDVDGWNTDIAIGTGDVVHISFYDNDPSTPGLRHGEKDGSWTVEEVDSNGYTGNGTSIAIDSDGYPHIIYWSWSSKDLDYAYENATGWQLMSSIEDVGEASGHASLALDSSDVPHIAYHDETDGELRYAYLSGTWQIETVDSAGDVGEFPSIAIDSSGYPHISYYDADNGDLKYARWNGSGWEIVVVDGASADVGSYSAIALDADDRAHFAYHSTTSTSLNYAKDMAD